MNESIDSLKDIYLPIKPSLFPLPWEANTIILVVLLLITVYIFYIRKKTFSKRIGVNKLEKIYEQYQKDNNSQHCVMQISIIMKRIALAYFPRKKVAKISGIEWLEFLDKTSRTTNFTKGPGSALKDTQYQASTDISVKDFMLVCKDWIKKR